MAIKLLILGGTRFLGRHVAEQALAAGHDVTLLHRGRTSGLFPQAIHHIADRNADLSALDGGTWDAVIDTSGYFPRQVLSAVERLRGRIGRYLFVSSISVYADFAPPGPAEGARRVVLANPITETVDGHSYGGLKALCEDALLAALPDAALVARPGLLVGPHDPTGRWTWWLQRIARGGDVLAPGDPGGPVQFIDARDAAAWLLRQAEAGSTGLFNLTGPAETLSMGGFLDTVRRTLCPTARLQWVPEHFLLAQGVAPWADLPAWVPHDESGLLQVDIGRALASGLRCRPLAQTLADTAAWAAAQEEPHPGVGLSAEREAALLAAWQAAG